MISEAYRDEQKRLHATGKYGVASLQFGGIVSELINETGAKTVLDYGCGSMQNLAKVLEPDHDIEYEGYDPAVDAFSSKTPADLVCCIDVLEHIEPEHLDSVLADLRSLAKGRGFFTVHTGPAVKTLSDGRNAHLIQKPPSWWFPKLSERFVIETYRTIPSGFFVVVY